MKRLFIWLLCAAALAGCAEKYYDSMGNPISKAQMEEFRTAAVRGHLEARRYRVFVDRMYPLRGPSVMLREDWGMEVSRDSVGLFLPYFGRVYQVPYGRGQGLNLVAPLTSYREEPIKNGVRIMMSTRSDQESYQLVMEVFDNAIINLSVIPSGKDVIRFTGMMELHDVFSMQKN